MTAWILLAAGEAATKNLSIFAPASPAAKSIAPGDAGAGDHGLDLRRRRGGAALFGCGGFAAGVRSDKSGEPPQVYGSKPIEIAWTAAPAADRVRPRAGHDPHAVGSRSRPAAAAKPGDHALFVTVVGRQWWWEYRYDHYDGKQLGFITANELHVPVERGWHAAAGLSDARNRPTFATAFGCRGWPARPTLIPGRTNSMWLQADETGLVRRPVRRILRHAARQHAAARGRRIAGRFRALAATNEAAAGGAMIAAARDGKDAVSCAVVRQLPSRARHAGRTATYAPRPDASDEPRRRWPPA